MEAVTVSPGHHTGVSVCFVETPGHPVGISSSAGPYVSSIQHPILPQLPLRLHTARGSDQKPRGGVPLDHFVSQVTSNPSANPVGSIINTYLKPDHSHHLLPPPFTKNLPVLSTLLREQPEALQWPTTSSTTGPTTPPLTGIQP